MFTRNLDPTSTVVDVNLPFRWVPDTSDLRSMSSQFTLSNASELSGHNKARSEVSNPSRLAISFIFLRICTPSSQQLRFDFPSPTSVQTSTIVHPYKGHLTSTIDTAIGRHNSATNGIVVTAASDKASWSHRYAAEFGNWWCRDLGRSAEVLIPLRAAMSRGHVAGTKLRRVNEVPNAGNVAKARLYTAVVRYGSG
uniref:F5/8 type C domain-containing protein n=1 Tax=Bursaphelenchus xylophilus TaxID=6326 RepID=A0A1I7SVC9_BURXY